VTVVLKSVAAIFFLFCLYACEFKPESPHAAEEQMLVDSQSEVAAANTKNVQTKSDKTPHHHHPLVKPGAAVSLKTAQPLSAPLPGLYEYQLQLVSPMQNGKMTVNVQAGEGFEIVSSARWFEFELQEGGEYHVPLTINATAKGRFYIQLHVSITTDGQSSSRVVAAILQVGEPAVKTQKTTLKTIREDDGVTSMPAHETISPR
jgi:hypothetical protein